MTELTLALGAFLVAFTGCIQAVNIVNGYRIRAGFTSIVIALSQLALYKTIPQTTDLGHITIFVLFGLAGSQSSMWFRNEVKTKNKEL